jgi:penicillin amidase
MALSRFIRPISRFLCGALVTLAFVTPGLTLAQDKAYILEGLKKPAEILRDKWGVPHIYADTQDDMFFSQGFNAARDRLWQLDLWRRQGEGKLAEQFGPRFVEQDRAARLFLYRGNMQREFESYHPEARQILTAFANGINAYVDMVLANPELLPFEFQLSGTKPGHWRPESSLIRLHGLTRNLGEEITNARRVHALGTEKVEDLSPYEPPVNLVVPAGLDLSQIDGRILQTYNLARGTLIFPSRRLSLESARACGPGGAGRGAVGGYRAALTREQQLDDLGKAHRERPPDPVQ